MWITAYFAFIVTTILIQLKYCPPFARLNVGIYTTFISGNFRLIKLVFCFRKTKEWINFEIKCSLLTIYGKTKEILC